MPTATDQPLPPLPTWRCLLAWLVLTLLLVSAAWPAINTANVELGDFAANSLLVQDAKSLRLLVGNYSRVGFNHPGPAILYVLAAGEWLLYDQLHLVKSGLSGQLVAVAAYNAAWLVLIFALARRLAGGAGRALLLVAVFALALAWCDHRIFTGLWFPNLYVLPFAATLLALARLAQGRFDLLPPLAVGAGFLLNGHVAFAAMLAIMLALVLLARPRLLSPAVLRPHARQLAAAVAVLALFLLPLLLETLCAWPGPVPAWLAYARAAKGNTLAEALRFVAVYWGGVSAVPGALVLLLTVLAAGAGLALPRAPRQAGAALLLVGGAASAAVLYYAKTAVDMLGETYLALFYYTVPCYLLALAVLLAYLAAPLPRKRLLAGVLVALCLAGGYRLVRQPVDYVDHYHQPLEAALYHELRQLQPTGRMVFDIEDAYDWGHLWVHAIGLQIYARRQGDDLFCVNQHWHISFTPAGRCSARELATQPHYFVHGAGHPEFEQAGTPAVRQLGMVIQRYLPPALGSGELRVARQPDSYGNALLRSGWSASGDEYVWSQDKEATLVLRAAAAYRGTLALDVMAFLPTPQSRQQVAVYVDDQAVGDYAFRPEDNRKTLRIPVTAAPGSMVTVRLKIAAPVSPKSVGWGDDARQLGVGLFGLSS